MRILFVLSTLASPRAEASEAKSTMKALLERGHQIGALHVQKGLVLTEEHPQLTHLPMMPGNYRSATAIQARIREFKPEAAHIVACWNPFHVRAASVLRNLGVPYILEPSGHLPRVHLDNRFAEKPCPPLYRIGRRIYQGFYDLPMLKKAALVRTLSAFEAADLRDRFGSRSKTIPLGYNSEWMTAVRLAQPAAVKPVRFLFVGRTDMFQKGIDLILQAAVLLNKAGRAEEYTVTIAGPEVNKSFARISRVIEREKLANVTLRQPVYDEEKQRLFAASDVFLHPSRFEGVAKLVREASGAGLAVLASLDSNYGDWARDHGLGLTAALTAEGVAQSMTEFIKDPARASEMGARGFAFARAWPWSRVAAELEECYQSVAAAPDQKVASA